MSKITCTFFGHRDCPADIRPLLYSSIEKLIVNDGVNHFLTGNQGKFDAYVQGALLQLKQRYPHITYCVVLAYLPAQSQRTELPTVFPEGMENVPAKFAISRRNHWMLKQSDIVLSYIARPWGGAAQMANRAARQGKTVINLYRYNEKSDT